MSTDHNTKTESMAEWLLPAGIIYPTTMICPQVKCMNVPIRTDDRFNFFTVAQQLGIMVQVR